MFLHPSWLESFPSELKSVSGFPALGLNRASQTQEAQHSGYSGEDERKSGILGLLVFRSFPQTPSTRAQARLPPWDVATWPTSHRLTEIPQAVTSLSLDPLLLVIPPKMFFSAWLRLTSCCSQQLFPWAGFPVFPSGLVVGLSKGTGFPRHLLCALLATISPHTALLKGIVIPLLQAQLRPRGGDATQRPCPQLPPSSGPGPVHQQVFISIPQGFSCLAWTPGKEESVHRPNSAAVNASLVFGGHVRASAREVSGPCTASEGRRADAGEPVLGQSSCLGW